MNTSMIKIEGLTFKYGKRASVFQDFSLEMEAGKGNRPFGQERYRKIYPVVSAERICYALRPDTFISGG